MCGGSDDAADEARRQEAARRRRIEQGTNRVNQLFQSRKNSGIYDQYEQDTLGLLRDRLDESKEEAARKLRFALARSGTVGGSNQVDQQANLRESSSLALLDAIRRARAARANLVSTDQEDKQNLLGLVQSGMSAGQAAREAAAAMKANTAMAQQFELPQTFDQFFADIAAYNAAQQRARARRLADLFYGPHGPESSGIYNPAIDFMGPWNA